MNERSRTVVITAPLSSQVFKHPILFVGPDLASAPDRKNQIHAPRPYLSSRAPREGSTWNQHTCTPKRALAVSISTVDITWITALRHRRRQLLTATY